MTGSDLRERLKGSQYSLAEIAEKIGTTPQALNQTLNAADVKSGFLEKLCSALDMEISSLYGVSSPSQHLTILQQKSPEKAGEEYVKLYDIEAAANLQSLLTDKSANVLGLITFPNLPKCDGAVYVRGDSMYPLLKSGDIVLFREIHDRQSIIFGEMYLVSIDMDGDEYLAVKYINASDKGDDYIRLVSYNAHHAPKDFPVEAIRAIALVKATIRMNTMK